MTDILDHAEPHMDGSMTLSVPKYTDGSPGQVRVTIPAPLVTAIRHLITERDGSRKQVALDALAQSRLTAERDAAIKHTEVAEAEVARLREIVGDYRARLGRAAQVYADAYLALDPTPPTDQGEGT